MYRYLLLAILHLWMKYESCTLKATHIIVSEPKCWRTDRQTDRRTDRRTDKLIPVGRPPSSGALIKILPIPLEALNMFYKRFIANSTWLLYQNWPLPNFRRFQLSICDGCGMPAGHAYQIGHLVPSFFGTCLRSNCWNNFFLSFRDFSPWPSLGTFLILPLRMSASAFVKNQSFWLFQSEAV